MNPRILSALRDVEIAETEASVAARARDRARVTCACVRDDLSGVVRDALRAAFPGAEVGSDRLYANAGPLHLNVVLVEQFETEPDSGVYAPIWCATLSLVEPRTGATWTEHGDDPAALVWALVRGALLWHSERLAATHGRDLLVKLGLVRFGSVTVGGVTVSAYGQDVVDLVKNLAAAVRDQAGVPAHAEGSTVCIDVSTSGRAGTFAVVESGKPES